MKLTPVSLSVRANYRLTLTLLAIATFHFACFFQEASASWTRHTIDNTSLGADGARSMDVNEDGLPDIVAGWEQGGVSRIYLMNREAGQLPTWTTIEAGPAPSVEDALLVDVDQDGAVDVISSTEGSNKKVLIHWAPSNPDDYSNSKKWNTETLFEDGSRWMFAIAMDVDGKNGPDIVVGGKGDDAKVGWLESPQNPRDTAAWKFHHLCDAGWIMSLISSDMDGDGDQDILMSDRKSTLGGIRWLENPGKKSAKLDSPWKNRWIVNHLEESMFIDTYDFDEDGSDEIVAPYYDEKNQGQMSIFNPLDLSTWRETRITYPDNMGRAKALSVGDINLDGKPDLVLSTEGAYEGRSGVVWLEYPESWNDSNWTVHDISGADGLKFDLNLLLDIDADGDLDIVNTEEANNASGGKRGLGLIWYENPTR